MSIDDFQQSDCSWIEIFPEDPQKKDITKVDINEIKSSGLFTPDERRAEYRRRGKSPSGVVDGVYNDGNRGNNQYNDLFRDREADA